MTQGPSIVCCLLDNTTENVRVIAYLHRTFKLEEFYECIKYRQRTPFGSYIFGLFKIFFFLVNMGYIKTKPQPQGLYNYKFGYKIDQSGLVSTAGTAPQVECLEYKNLAD